MSRQLVFWRHGRTAWNATGRVQGQSEVPLDEVGREQAASAASRLAALSPVRIVTSDLERAAATAEVLGRLVGIVVETDSRLREMSFGIREGLTTAEALEKFPQEMEAWLANRDIRMPGGETYAEAAERFRTGVAEVADAMADDETVVIVAHGAVLRVGICAFLGLPQEHWGAFGGFNNCAWTVLEETQKRWRVAEWNAGTLPAPVLSDET
ncbi:MAG: histidine phosphatase family protein [Nocardioidaceae bacterium]